jgi:hypothetical protein
MLKRLPPKRLLPPLRRLKRLPLPSNLPAMK